MSDKKILVKEVCHKKSVLSQFDGCIETPIPIHEIYEIKHEIKSPRVLIGKKVIALLGKIMLKVYCVKKESLEIFLIERAFDYRNYIPGDYGFHHLKTCTSINNELQDIIIESIEEDGIRLAGIIQTHLTITLEKEYDLTLLMSHKRLKEEQTGEVREPISSPTCHEYGIEKPIDDNLLFKESIASSIDDSTDENGEEEIYAEVIQGHNQDLTIILE